MLQLKIHSHCTPLYIAFNAHVLGDYNAFLRPLKLVRGWGGSKSSIVVAKAMSIEGNVQLVMMPVVDLGG